MNSIIFESKEATTINGYLDWYGDLTFKELEFNEVDSLIFSLIVYNNFSELLATENTIEKFANQYFKNHDIDQISANYTLTPEAPYLLKKVSLKLRYQNLELFDFQEILDEETSQQFAALTIKLAENKYYIAFRGTDSTVIGWKEDLDLLWKKEIPSQMQSRQYLNAILKKYDVTFLNKLLRKKPSIIIGGHSKGGHLAIYSAIKANQHLVDYIDEIYSFDGPGFKEETLKTKEFKKIKAKIKFYVPENSFFGLIMNKAVEPTVVKSNRKDLQCHSGYTWLLSADGFETVQAVAAKNVNAVTELNDYIMSLTEEETEQFINQFYQLLKQSKIIDVGDFSKMNPVNAIHSVSALANVNLKSQQILYKMFIALFKTNVL